MIKITHLYKTLNQQVILKDVNLTVQSGEICVILGESGAGKSVLLQHMIGLFEPDQGDIAIDAVSVKHFSDAQWLLLRKTMGYLFQDGALYDFMTIFENVAFPLQEHTKYTQNEILEKVYHALKLVGLEGEERKFPPQLSGGMRKRAALARAVILNSKILFCDEPTSGLDPIRSRDIMDLIRDISRRFKTTTVIASHDIQNSFRIADRLAIIKAGEIVAQGKPQEIRAIHNDFIQAFIN
ncbi:MAG: ATP-binding cassette domain-containing protein [Candidatus Omnitrophota bacterium]|jgi:phospholipid/cholesterol/gamma-HCH transport system ATP-binding protein